MPSRSASAAAISTASRAAPVIASLASWTIELNCLPRRVESAKRPSAGSGSGTVTVAKCALPSGVGKSRPLG